MHLKDDKRRLFFVGVTLLNDGVTLRVNRLLVFVAAWLSGICVLSEITLALSLPALGRPLEHDLNTEN